MKLAKSNKRSFFVRLKGLPILIKHYMKGQPIMANISTNEKFYELGQDTHLLNLNNDYGLLFDGGTDEETVFFNIDIGSK